MKRILKKAAGAALLTAVLGTLLAPTAVQHGIGAALANLQKETERDQEVVEL